MKHFRATLILLVARLLRVPVRVSDEYRLRAGALHPFDAVGLGVERGPIESGRKFNHN